MKAAVCFIGCILLLSGTSQACFIVGDLNGDCRVGMEDLLLMAAQWMAPSSCGSEAGLVAHWRLDESSGSIAIDSSASGYDGTVFGASWNPSGGILGGALQFDGTNDYMYRNGYQGISGSNPRTCTAWIKTDRPSGEIMSWGDRDVDGGRWVIWVDQTGVLRVDVGGGYIFGTTVLTDDRWHHVAVTSGGSATDQITLYVDGMIETIAEIASTPINTFPRATVKLGVFQLLYMEGSYFDGLIDDARIYNRVLSLQEIWSVAKTGTTDYACADMNLDQTVNLIDLAMMSRDWNNAGPVISINEFLADNESKSPLGPGEILDGNGEASDWIELHNNSQVTVDIGGWYLTDDVDLKTQWRFPASTILQPGDYLVVFASGKTQAQNPDNYPYVDSAGYLHTNFALSKNGEYLGLYAADGITPVHEYNQFYLNGKYGYPEQAKDISYGYYYDEARYFAVPTPGTDNVGSPFEEVVEKPDVNFKGGCYLDAVDVTLSCGTDGAFIQYTTDGTVPSLTNGLQYTGPVAVSSTTRLIAKAFKPGLRSSDTRIETYIFVESDISPSNTNLPIVVVDTLGVGIVDDAVNKPWTQCIAVIVDVDAVTSRASITGPEHFNGLGQIRYRGESTYGTKRHFRVETLDEYGQDKKVSLLDMPAESDWVLSNDQLDYTMMKKGLAYKWFQDMGHYAPRQRYVELYLNLDGGKITSSDYLGLFILREKIKRDNDRVDIARLDASHNLEPKVSGGYIIKSDKYDEGDTLLADGVAPDYLEWQPYGIQVTGAGKPILAEPDALVVTRPQIEWIAGYLNTISAVLWQNTSSVFYPGSQATYTDYLDVISWIDHGILEQVCADSDAFWGSYFTYKDRDGKHFSGPPWDYDRGFHNNGDKYDQPYNVWKNNAAIFGKWHQKLQEDVEYKMLLADRWFEHREVVLNTALTMDYIDEMKALISESRLERPKKTYLKPFDEEIQLFKTWITNRLNWLDGKIAGTFAQKPPIFNPVGGYVNSGDPLYINKPAGVSGDIYYTLNGEDPRLEGGAINPNAQLFTAAGGSATESLVTMFSSVWNYLYDGSDLGTAWRAYGFDDSSWGAGPGQLGFGQDGITTDIGPRVVGRRSAYFRHKFNVSNISNLTTLAMTVVHDDGAVVYLNGQEIGRIYMPDGDIDYNTLATTTVHSTPVITVFSEISPNYLVEGENILAVSVHQVTDTSSDIVFDLELEATRTAGPSQIAFEKSVCVKARIWDGGNWSAVNTEVYGVGPVRENLRISELMYHPADSNTEFIELLNVGTEAINLNRVTFTQGVQWTFGDTVLVPGQYALLVEDIDAFTARYGDGLNVVGQYTGRLDNAGETIEFKDALGAVIQLFRYQDNWYELTDGPGFSLTAADPYSDDPADWNNKYGWRSSIFEGGTPGTADMALAADSIVINELLAHSHGTASDWIELHNTTLQDIHLGGWFLSDDDRDLDAIRKYEIPSNTVIGAQGYLVFVQSTSFGNPALPSGNGFGLSEGGETVYLYSGQNGQVTGYYQTQQKFDASETGVTFGRYEKAELSGGYDFVRMAAATPGQANSTPLIPEIVITEIYYHPPSGADDEFVELRNRSGSPVTLMTQVTTETAPGLFISESLPWRLNGIGFVFPPHVTVAAGETILVARDPARYSAAACAVYGPYDGKLDNSGEEIQLCIPGDLEYGKERYWIPIEKIEYDDAAPWPTSADGEGDSLHRINIHVYGRDHSNWNAALPTPGT